MRPFDYARAVTLPEAIAASAQGATLIAGGTELVNWMKDSIVSPQRVVDINGITGLAGISFADGALRIGSLVRMSALAEHPDVVREFPALTQALAKSASQQIRNMASMGGNLLQRTRCPYFRSDVQVACNKRSPGTGCSAARGEDRASAIFGTSEQCIATHPSDAAVAFAALDATVQLQGPSGARDVPVSDLYRLPRDSAHLDTVIEPGEVIVSISLPASPAARRSQYLKIRERASYEFALVSAAAAVELDGSVIRTARLALGGVAPKPWRLSSTEASLAGLRIDDTRSLVGAMRPEFARARPGRHNGFKVELALRTAVRALQTAGGVA